MSEYQHSSELSALVRKYDKVARDAQAKRWRAAREQNPRLARLVFITHKRAMDQAIIDFWNTPSHPNSGLAKLLSENPE